MPYHEAKTLINEDSKVRIDVETMARIELSDIDYLLNKINKETDSQLVRIMYETVVTKLSTVFQLAIKAYKYLEKDIERKVLIANSKDTSTALSKVYKFRGDLFHSGISFVKKDTFYPFGSIKGRAFVALRIRRDAILRIKGVVELNAIKTEYVITSEGVFEIHNLGELSEEWISTDIIPTLTAVNYDETSDIILKAKTELKTIWYQLSLVREQGDGDNQYQYLNEGGEWELLEKKGDKITKYSAKQKTINITGDFTITPPDSIRIENGQLSYE